MASWPSPGVWSKERSSAHYLCPSMHLLPHLKRLVLAALGVAAALVSCFPSRDSDRETADADASPPAPLPSASASAAPPAPAPPSSSEAPLSAAPPEDDSVLPSTLEA